MQHGLNSARYHPVDPFWPCTRPGIADAIAAAGASLLYLRGHGPDLHRIERFFAKLKVLLHTAATRTREMLSQTFEQLLDEAIAEAAVRPNLRVVREKSQDQLDLQACHRVRSRLVSRRTATIDQIRAFLIEQGIAVRAGPRALRNSLFAILENRKDEISPRMAKLILGLYEDWCYLDERIEPAIPG